MAVLTGSFDFAALKFKTWTWGETVTGAAAAKIVPLGQQLASGAFWLKMLLTAVVLGVLFTVGAKLTGGKVSKFIPAFIGVFLLSVVVRLISAEFTLNRYLEWAFWALIVGMLISNTIGTPGWLKPAVRTEFYIKTGLVIMGFSVLFSNIAKFGLYQTYGSAADAVKDLLMFASSFKPEVKEGEEAKPAGKVTLAEYVDRMKEEQKFIYYACGESAAKIELLPAFEKVTEKGYEVLYFTQDIDEFAMKALMTYKEKPFKNITDADLGLETEEEKEENKKTAEESKDMFEFMKDALGGKVKEVRLSTRLKSHPVCLSSEGQVSIEMEKVLNSMPQNDNNRITAQKSLELNAAHPVFTKLKELFESDKDKLAEYTKLLYSQALLIEGLTIENPVEFADLICKLMV